MNFTFMRNTKITAYLLLAVAGTQLLYTLLKTGGIEVPRQLLWGLECLLFTTLIAFAGAALVQAKSQHVGWSAIAFCGVLNVVQVSIGLTLFGPFGEASSQLEALAPLAGAVVALSFMIYYAAKLLLGLAALVFGVAKISEGAKALGALTTVVGVVAICSNAALIVFGRDALVPSAVAGGSGVLATWLLALCLMNINGDKSQI